MDRVKDKAAWGLIIQKVRESVKGMNEWRRLGGSVTSALPKYEITMSDLLVLCN